MNDNTKRFLKDQLIWIGIYFGIAIVVSSFIPFPYSLLVIIAIILPLSFYRRRRMMKKMGLAGNTSFFGGMGGGMFGSRGGMSYYCISCGMKHNQAECPRCGSKMKKGAFDG
jgi:hypothetical protein